MNKFRYMAGILFFIFTLCSISACGKLSGGYQEGDSIGAADPVSGKSLSLSLKSHSTSDPFTDYFYVQMELTELAEAIDENNLSITCEICQDQYILLKQSSATAANTFLIQELDPEGIGITLEEGNRLYAFFSAVGTFQRGENGEETNLNIPYHLLSGLDHVMTYPHDGTAYPSEFVCEAVGTIDDIYNFYLPISTCDVEKDGDTLSITYLSYVPATGSTEAYKDKIHMTLTFFEEDGVSKVRFAVT